MKGWLPLACSSNPISCCHEVSVCVLFELPELVIGYMLVVRREDLRQEYERKFKIKKKVPDRKIIDWKKKILSERNYGTDTLLHQAKRYYRQEHKSTTHGAGSTIELVRF